MVQTLTKYVVSNNDSVEWSIEVCNDGTDTCKAAQLEIAVLEPGLEIEFVSKTRGLYAKTSRIWTFGDLDGGECVNITFKVSVEDISLLLPRLGVRADVTSECVDVDTDNNCYWLYIEESPTDCINPTLKLNVV